MSSGLGIITIEQEIYDMGYYVTKGHHNRRPGTNESLEPILPARCLRCGTIFTPTREHEYADHCPECLSVPVRAL